MILHNMGLPKAHFFLLGSLIPPKVHFGGSEGDRMKQALADNYRTGPSSLPSYLFTNIIIPIKHAVQH